MEEMGGRIEDLQKNVNDLMAQAGIDSPAQKHRQTHLPWNAVLPAGAEHRALRGLVARNVVPSCHHPDSSGLF
ncbi:hypothetical protein Celaphus_00017544, partial [Cervus elaphus hippelaphus]